MQQMNGANANAAKTWRYSWAHKKENYKHLKQVP
jgi:hypothetical protein